VSQDSMTICAPKSTLSGPAFTSFSAKTRTTSDR
jgi:hypothetical protein